MEPFCTVEEYRAKFPSDPIADVVLRELLLEATDTISAELDASDVSYTDTSESFTFRLMRVCRDMAQRASERMASPLPSGVSQESVSQGAGSYTGTKTYTYAMPYVGVTILPRERTLLGIDTSAVAFASPTMPVGDTP